MSKQGISLQDKNRFDRHVSDYQQLDQQIVDQKRRDCITIIDREMAKYGDIEELVKHTEKLVVHNHFRTQNILFKPRPSGVKLYFFKIRDFFISLFSCGKAGERRRGSQQGQKHPARPVR